MAGKELQLVLVTPEKTLLDEPVEALRFPLYDGQIGILPGRAPMIGRLGYGELKITRASGEESYYIDGGFVQVKENIVSILTNRAIPANDVDTAQAQALLAEATARVATTDVAAEAKERDEVRARQMLTVARK
jgi:F-type H+-transporting ATPase subunit epsilon